MGYDVCHSCAENGGRIGFGGVCCYAMMSTVIKSVRTLRSDSRLVVFSYVIGFVVFVDVSSGTPSRLQ